MNLTLLTNSILLAGGAMILAAVFGFFTALFAACSGKRVRILLLAAAVVALVLPPFLVVNLWLHLLGFTGVWRGFLPFNIYSIGGAIWILALLTWPLTFLLVLGSWQVLENNQLESEPALAGWPLVRWLLYPVARPALGVGAFITFVLAFNNFSVPAILQVKVFPAELWVSFNTTFNYREALKLSWPLFLIPLLLLLWARGRSVEWPRLEGSVSPGLLRSQLGRAGYLLAGAVACFTILFSTGLPLAELLGSSRTWTEFAPAYRAGQLAVWNSFLMAGAGAAFCTGGGLLLWRARWGAALWVLFLMPGILLGIGLIYLLNHSWSAVFYQSIGIVLAGLFLRYAALAWSVSGRAMRTLDRDLTDAARLCGASGWELFRQIQWPQVAPQILGIAYITYLLCLWDVETLMFVIPPGRETVALRVFNLLHYGHTGQVHALCAILVFLALMPLAAWMAWRFFQRGRAAVCLAPLLCFSGCTEEEGRTRLQSELFSHVEVIGSRGTGAGQFNKPRSVALDEEDNLYVVDMTGRVQKFSPESQFILSWQLPETDVGQPKGMYRDHLGNIVVVEPHYSRVNHFSTSGELAAQWGDNGTAPGQLMFPRAAAVGSTGEIYISEYGMVERVQKFSPGGQALIWSVGMPGTGPGQFTRPEGLGLDSEGRIYVADSCNHRIQVLSSDGQFIRMYGRAGRGRGEFSYPYDVRVDEQGRQYVCEFGNSRIQIFDRHGETVEILGGPGGAPGQFANPWAIALDSQGNLYVADSQNHRVQKFLRRDRPGEELGSAFARNALLSPELEARP
jgi:ABC-type Fe3+ transport system permease subunit/DNA-binding beta-propeller fold protein YncE